MSTSGDAPTAPAAAASEEEQLTINIKSTGDKKYTATIAPSKTVQDLKKHLHEQHPDEIPAEPRLIYSGRVLKNPDTLASYNIKTGNTIHMVKPAASATRQAASNSSSVPPVNIAAGTGNDPLAGLTGARYAGHVQLPSAGLFGPDGGMGPPPGPEQLAAQMNDPLQQAMLQRILSDPAILDQIISSNPMLSQIPGAREMLQSPMMRQMLTDPQLMMQMAQMSGMGGGAGGLGGFGARGNNNSFPAPGQNETTTGSTPANTATSATGNTNTNPQGTGAQSPGNTAGSPPPFPFPFPFGAPGGGLGAMMNNPQMQEQMRQLMGSLAGAGDGSSPGANPFGFGSPLGGSSPAAPADTRPPEERYADQLRQLNDMGFYDFERNVEALRRSGGSVQGAVNQLLGG
ncbi:hypothetical protein EX30DRAFT_315126 [Ascodesmis nigricans]|uniref:Ubiquitin-domain-containing protein n=1 Tax=Ascodesmis nigricans TaxID=341454 RepID=A0A4S2N350_9PEZI|nr:hypothetical protein EX30DRAFT_315126 [Ascodesmis nigricans]